MEEENREFDYFGSFFLVIGRNRFNNIKILKYYICRHSYNCEY